MSRILSERKQLEVLRFLMEGGSINGVSRLTGIHRGTIRRLMVRFGEGCRRFLDREMRDLRLAHIQCDELWTFCQKKQKTANRQHDDSPEVGTFWIFVAMDEATRLIPAFRLDRKDDRATHLFIADLRSRLRDDQSKPHDTDTHAYTEGRATPITRISTDAYESYKTAIDAVFSNRVQYGRLTKTFRQEKDQNDKTKTITRVDVRKEQIIRQNEFDEAGITTSLIERSNLTARHFVKRLSRRTICFSKKLENLRAALAIHFAAYNYCWTIKTLKTTPAVAAGVTDRKWTHADLYEHIRSQWPELFFLKPQKMSA